MLAHDRRGSWSKILGTEHTLVDFYSGRDAKHQKRAVKPSTTARDPEGDGGIEGIKHKGIKEWSQEGT